MKKEDASKKEKEKNQNKKKIHEELINLGETTPPPSKKNLELCNDFVDFTFAVTDRHEGKRRISQTSDQKIEKKKEKKKAYDNEPQHRSYCPSKLGVAHLSIDPEVRMHARTRTHEPHSRAAQVPRWADRRNAATT